MHWFFRKKNIKFKFVNISSNNKNIINIKLFVGLKTFYGKLSFIHKLFFV